jgi:hypothetical protein
MNIGPLDAAEVKSQEENQYAKPRIQDLTTVKNTRSVPKEAKLRLPCKQKLTKKIRHLYQIG